MFRSAFRVLVPDDPVTESVPHRISLDGDLVEGVALDIVVRRELQPESNSIANDIAVSRRCGRTRSLIDVLQTVKRSRGFYTFEMTSPPSGGFVHNAPFVPIKCTRSDKSLDLGSRRNGDTIASFPSFLFFFNFFTEVVARARESRFSFGRYAVQCGRNVDWQVDRVSLNDSKY